MYPFSCLLSPLCPPKTLLLYAWTPSSDSGASPNGLGKWIRFHYWNVSLLLIALKTMNASWVLWWLHVKNSKLASSLCWRWGKEVRRGGSWQSIFHQRQTASLLSSTTSCRTEEVWCSSCSLNTDNLSPCTYQQMGERWGSPSKSKSWMKSSWNWASRWLVVIPWAHTAPLCSWVGSVGILPQTLRCEGGACFVCLQRCKPLPSFVFEDYDPWDEPR